VGPDRAHKKDNLSKSNWQFEGDEMRQFWAENNVIVIYGDRHWQYHSKDDVRGARIQRRGIIGGSCGRL
jgi:alkaline phosphatase D